MTTRQQKGEFLLRFANSDQKETKAPQGLVLYKDVICIRTFIEKANCINFVTQEHLDLLR